MKLRVATKERGDKRERPHTPWPLVQPEASRANAHQQTGHDHRPKPGVDARFRGKASRRQGHEDRGRSQHTQQKSDPPADVADFGGQQPTQNTADAQDAAIDQDEYGRGHAQQQTPDE